MPLALFARQQQKFGSREERDHSSVDLSPLWRGRKSGRLPRAERKRDCEGEGHKKMRYEV